MALSVKLQVFEGPLDLLLHLIEINKTASSETMKPFLFYCIVAALF